MAYDERLADHVRELIGERTNVTERRMFGGLTFMVRGGGGVRRSHLWPQVRSGRRSSGDREGQCNPQTRSACVRAITRASSEALGFDQREEVGQFSVSLFRCGGRQRSASATALAQCPMGLLSLVQGMPLILARSRVVRSRPWGSGS